MRLYNPESRLGTNLDILRVIGGAGTLLAEISLVAAEKLQMDSWTGRILGGVAILGVIQSVGPFARLRPSSDSVIRE